jgi:hypothetical protein
MVDKLERFPKSGRGLPAKSPTNGMGGLAPRCEIEPRENIILMLANAKCRVAAIENQMPNARLEFKCV